MSSQLKILAIHSLATHGVASMKTVLSILGSRVLPVPSLYLTGLTNIPGHQKFSLPFEAMLRGSLELCRQAGDRLLLYVGYLGDEQQAAQLLACIQEYSELIDHILVDPVSGDHGKLYVPAEVLASWPALLEQAAWALPNYTELQLLSGLPPGQNRAPEEYVQAFHNRFPHLSFVVTSFPFSAQQGIYLLHRGQSFCWQHEQLELNFGGTGDVFAATFIQQHWLRQQDAQQAVKAAAARCLLLLKHAHTKGLRQLEIE
ncbi:MAG: hypothetical protein D6730_21270 [Bacteroidetes bacterium]|nr:MAG: hypothetical protein D6730_21270 [Bacteroidota bacterium]